MIVVRTPLDDLFNYTECEELYNQCKNEIQDDDFKDVIKRTFFYSFYEWNTGELIGCIYYFYKGKKLFVNAYARNYAVRSRGKTERARESNSPTECRKSADFRNEVAGGVRTVISKGEHHLLNLECFKKSLEWFKCNIYAEGLHRTSRLCLLKCGFKRIKGNLFIYNRRCERQ